MKTLNVTFTDAEYRKLLKAKRAYNKGHSSWRSFLLNNATRGISEKRGKE